MSESTPTKDYGRAVLQPLVLRLHEVSAASENLTKFTTSKETDEMNSW